MGVCIDALQSHHLNILNFPSQVAALKGYKDANMRALDLWEEVYPGEPFFALTDTFTTKAFFQVGIWFTPGLNLLIRGINIQGFATNPDRIPRWHGLRQDSGDPFAFAPQVQQLYQSLGIDSQGKAIIYSDGLDVTKCLELQRQCETLGFQGKSPIVWNKDTEPLSCHSIIWHRDLINQ